MAFETYVPHAGRNAVKSNRNKKIPAIRLSKSSVVINKWAREFFHAANIELAFDPETNTIRIGPGGTIKLNNSKVFAKGFFRHFGITTVGLFPVEVDNGHLYAKLS